MDSDIHVDVKVSLNVSLTTMYILFLTFILFVNYIKKIMNVVTYTNRHLKSNKCEGFDGGHVSMALNIFMHKQWFSA